jgi:hypothetical protein
VILSAVTGISLVWWTDESLCNTVTTFGAFIITLYTFISNWDVMSVILNPMTRWPLDPYANNTSIVVEPYVPRVVNGLPMLAGSTLSSTTATALPSPTGAAAAALPQQQQHMMAPVATVTTTREVLTPTSTVVTAVAAAAAVTLPITTSTAELAPSPVRRNKSFMR